MAVHNTLFSIYKFYGIGGGSENVGRSLMFLKDRINIYDQNNFTRI